MVEEGGQAEEEVAGSLALALVLALQLGPLTGCYTGECQALVGQEQGQKQPLPLV